ncbi:DNA (cytosine-5-)-methyltransferase [Tenacibaculum maritimum]|uniref:DNA (cytosine-5-)-methyltransferase n=1 Tax=Tenacibaculum maritimum TaxID=107401 RepID=UPI001E4746CD|nr:DNA (cytosine-5-)-methyltransferase [Tenacibaculum maritimum]MCD9564035.1 DNA (cytosine-5-)-methyltransferase [Tenacibaculum maritimum]MCD9564388.1 DNA (cytosine-5-)-methyltransferase [Tenacibaculum maritimum]MCD9578260.1 DNA (cytosine-5-)-methyltransferase [Tenacibaculum maritimum]MCD9598040.1 DNA (cytosine-5-)-methyltransferase [Tenacibaculum maritimum]MCD9614921.1 DNA (cytosine-5-)-methyltransferase [Tenacibaculum maritimum]
MSKVKFIDLFAGLGGIRLGFEKSFQDLGFETECVMTSEIKPYAIETLSKNFSHDYFVGDIFNVENGQIPEFDFLLGGFPCQPFSAGGKREGFVDTRGTLFFEIERILKEKKPYGFILENVEGLVKHDLENKEDKIGRTLTTILEKLKNELGYKVSWKVLDSIEFGLPQSRKRIFIVGTKDEKANLTFSDKEFNTLSTILEKGLETINSDFTEKLFKHFEIEDLYGKSIKDKRGGDNNIHSWDIGIKGEVSDEQVIILNKLFKERRKKHWAEKIGIDWMDGMALTLKQISTFHSNDNLKFLLDDLVKKGYLRFEHPKKLVRETTENGERKFRVYDETKPKGYNIVTGKLSFEINKILDPNDIAPTLVATDVSRLAVPDNGGLRRLTIREGLRLFGYPEWYQIPVKETEAFDLLGNTVAVPVVEHVAKQLAEIYERNLVYPTVNETPVCSR